MNCVRCGVIHVNEQTCEEYQQLGETNMDVRMNEEKILVRIIDIDICITIYLRLEYVLFHCNCRIVGTQAKRLHLMLLVLTYV